MKRIIVGLLSLVAAFAFHGCKTAGFKTISAEECRAMLQDPKVQLLDVRTAGEYEAGHIQGAVLIPVTDGDFIDKATVVLDKAHPVVVYCRSGKRSARAATLLSEKGYKVYSLEDGYIAYVNE